jgi:hypothetical protein
MLIPLAESKKVKSNFPFSFLPKFFLILFGILEFWEMQKMKNQICCEKGEK